MSSRHDLSVSQNRTSKIGESFLHIVPLQPITLARHAMPSFSQPPLGGRLFEVVEILHQLFVCHPHRLVIPPNVRPHCPGGGATTAAGSTGATWWWRRWHAVEHRVRSDADAALRTLVRRHDAVSLRAAARVAIAPWSADRPAVIAVEVRLCHQRRLTLCVDRVPLQRLAPDPHPVLRLTHRIGSVRRRREALALVAHYEHDAVDGEHDDGDAEHAQQHVHPNLERRHSRRRHQALRLMLLARDALDPVRKVVDSDIWWGVFTRFLAVH